MSVWITSELVGVSYHVLTVMVTLAGHHYSVQVAYVIGVQNI